MQFAGKNFIVNGNFDFWTKGSTSTSAGYQTADRWFENATAATTFAQESTVVPTGSKYSFKMTAGATAVMNNSQSIETVNTLPLVGQPVTASIRVQASVSTSMNLQLYYSTSVDNPASGSWTNIVATTGGTGTAISGSFTRITGTFAVPSTAKSLLFLISTASSVSSGVIVYVGQAQLELGSTATTFSRAGGNYNGEITVSGSPIQDGILYSSTPSTSPSGSGSNAWAGYSPAGKNAIINGGMDIWQRGTSFTATGYTADRWYAFVSGTCTVSQITSSLPSNFQYGIQWVVGASNSYSQFIQAIEKANVIPLQGKTMTISGWVKASANFVGNWIFQNYYSTSTDTLVGDNVQNGSNVVIATNATTTWTRFSVTFTVPSTAVGLSMNFVPDNAAQVSTGTIQMTGIQLELGSTATTFSRAGGSIGGELALCQRYYWRTNSATDGSSAFGVGPGTSTTVSDAVIKNPVTMRIAPTSVDYAGLRVYDSVTATTASSLVITGAGIDNTRVAVIVASGLTQYRPYELIGNSGTSYLGFSAEL